MLEATKTSFNNFKKKLYCIFQCPVSQTTLKGTVHPKRMKILSMFTPAHAVTNLYELICSNRIFEECL